MNADRKPSVEFKFKSANPFEFWKIRQLLVPIIHPCNIIVVLGGIFGMLFKYDVMIEGERLRII